MTNRLHNLIRQACKDARAENWNAIAGTLTEALALVEDSERKVAEAEAKAGMAGEGLGPWGYCGHKGCEGHLLTFDCSPSRRE